MKFLAKKDTAFSLPLLIPVGIALLIAFWYLLQYRTNGAFLAVVVNLFLLWGIYYFWTSTYYEVKEQRLHYYSGFMKGDIPINKITHIKASTYPTSGNRPALSFTGLTIFYGAGNELYISPMKEEDLIQTLKTKNKKIKIKI